MDLKQKISFNDIVSWKKPAVTVTFLVILNLAFIIFRSLNLSLISTACQKIFFWTIILIIKNQLMPASEACSWFKKENIENTFITVYDTINKQMDKLRQIVLLHEIPSLVRLLVGLFFVIFFGSYFCTLSLAVLSLNFYILYNFGTVRDRVKEYSNIAIGLTTRIISDAIPKYKEMSK